MALLMLLSCYINLRPVKTVGEEKTGWLVLSPEHPHLNEAFMKTVDEKAAQKLSEGQLWRLKGRYVLIVALENLCVQFKLMDAPDQTGERTLTGDIDTLWRYLTSRKAKLI